MQVEFPGSLESRAGKLQIASENREFLSDFLVSMVYAKPSQLGTRDPCQGVPREQRQPWGLCLPRRVPGGWLRLPLAWLRLRLGLALAFWLGLGSGSAWLWLFGLAWLRAWLLGLGLA